MVRSGLRKYKKKVIVVIEYSTDKVSLVIVKFEVIVTDRMSLVIVKFVLIVTDRMSLVIVKFVLIVTDKMSFGDRKL